MNAPQSVDLAPRSSRPPPRVAENDNARTAIPYFAPEKEWPGGHPADRGEPCECGAAPWEIHATTACLVERCAVCGWQRWSCLCDLALDGVPVTTRNAAGLDIPEGPAVLREMLDPNYDGSATHQRRRALYAAAEDAAGGPIPWGRERT